MKDIKLLYVEDDEENRKMLVQVLNDEEIEGFILKIEAIDTFEEAVEKIKSENYNIVILDLYKGNPIEKGEQIGLQILEQIQQQFFVPIIFFSGNTAHVKDLKSKIISVVTKGDGGIDELKKEILKMAHSNLPFLKENVQLHLNTEFKNYFWDIIHHQREKFNAEENDFSLGYLMLRKFGDSLSKEKVSEIIGDLTIKKDKAHPMEFYIYPTNNGNEYESGELLEIKGEILIILTPSCDFIDKGKQPRKVGKVLLANTTLLSEDDIYKKYKANPKPENKESLRRLIECRKGDRYFFLPRTPFIENRIVDFQMKEVVNYEDLKNYKRLAKLDNPFAQSMVSSFVRYYNRIGFPDIDSDLVIGLL